MGFPVNFPIIQFSASWTIPKIQQQDINTNHLSTREKGNVFSQIDQEWFGGISGNGGVATNEPLTIARLQSNWISTDGTCKSRALQLFLSIPKSIVAILHVWEIWIMGNLLGFEVYISPPVWNSLRNFRELVRAKRRVAGWFAGWVAPGRPGSYIGHRESPQSSDVAKWGR